MLKRASGGAKASHTAQPCTHQSSVLTSLAVPAGHSLSLNLLIKDAPEALASFLFTLSPLVISSNLLALNAISIYISQTAKSHLQPQLFP